MQTDIKMVFSTNISLHRLLSTVRPWGAINRVPPDRGKLVTRIVGVCVQHSSEAHCTVSAVCSGIHRFLHRTAPPYLPGWVTALNHWRQTLMLTAASDRPARLLSSCRQLAGPHLATGHFQWLLLVPGTTYHLVSDPRRPWPRSFSHSRQCSLRCPTWITGQLPPFCTDIQLYSPFGRIKIKYKHSKTGHT